MFAQISSVFHIVSNAFYRKENPVNIKKTRYAIACPTSMGVRITPAERQPAHTSHIFQMEATSAESNVLNIASSLENECLALTKFVEGSPISLFIQSELRARNIRFEGVSVPQDGLWGFRHQFNIADSGYGLRGPRVWNDRAGEVGRTLSIDEFDIPRIFGTEGVGILHTPGQWFVEQPREIPVLDRIGGGDGFTGGLLYGISKGWEAGKCLHFGWASGALAATVLTDFASPADKEQVWSIYEGNARVKR